MMTSYVKIAGYVVSYYANDTDADFTLNTYMHVTDTMQQIFTNTLENLLMKSY